MLAAVNVQSLALAANDAASRPTAPLHLTTSPLPITLDANPGQTVTTEIKIKQSGGDDETLMVHLLKFAAYGDTGKPALSERGPEDAWFDWASFDKPSFDAPNNVWQTVKMTIKIPKTAAFEYNYAVEFTRAGDTNTPSGGGKVTTGIAGGTAVLVLVNVNAPGAHRHMSLESFGVEHRIVEFLPTTFDVKLNNDGNVFLQPLGTIFVTQGKNQVGHIVFNEQKGNMLANSHRLYLSTWTDGWPHFDVAKTSDNKTKTDRHGNVEKTVSFSLPTANSTVDGTDASTANPIMQAEGNNPLSRFRFGQYTARLVVVYADDFGRDVPVTSQITFWVIPWRIMLVLLVVLVVLGLAVYYLISNAARSRRRLKLLEQRRRR
jgi:hypothetical protein